MQSKETESAHTPKTPVNAPTRPAQDDAPAHATPSLPDDALIIIPVRNLVLFPQLVVPISIGRESSSH